MKYPMRKWNKIWSQRAKIRVQLKARPKVKKIRALTKKLSNKALWKETKWKIKA
jgi:hypothetical protein